ncbi:LysR family transcriptional regulator [Enterococcus crotali]|uniref:LysR family transcriptional regulator n=1 Tax=Enterococcus crotali TaxID=1453587 RepID=UPI00046F7C08|nr:LysR family transcriptional regulator [Enterococcus crotali]
MELTLLNYFLALCEQKQFTRASNTLGISQAALSKQIKNLEEEIGTALFYRNGVTCKLTPAGKILEAHCWRIKQELFYIHEEINDLSSLKNSYETINLSLFLNDLEFKLNDTLSTFFREHQDLRINTIVSDNIFNSLETLESDIGIGPSIKNLPSTIKKIDIYSNEYQIIVRNDHPILEHSTISLDSLGDYPFVFFNQRFLETKTIYDWMQLNLPTRSKENDIQVDTTELILYMVSNTEAFSIVPQYIECHLDPLKIISINHDSLPLRVMSVYFLKNKYMRPHLKQALASFTGMLFH